MAWRKDKGGRPRIYHRRMELHLPDNVLQQVDEVSTKMAVASVVGKVIGTVAVDASLLGLGYWLGSEHGLALPGGQLWSVVGIPDYSSLRSEKQRELWSAEALWNAKQKIWNDLLADENKYPVHHFDDCDPDDERRCVHVPGMERAERLYNEALEAFNSVKMLQGVLYALFIYLLAKHLGGIAQGIGAIIPG